MEGMLGILLRQPRAFDNLHLVNFQYVERQGRDDWCLPNTFRRILARQAYDDVTSRQDATSMGSLHRVTATSEVVSTIDAAQSLIIGTLDTILYKYEGMLVQLRQIVEQLVAHAVRSGADNDAHDIFHLQCLLIHLPQVFHLVVGIGVCLEVSKILHVGVFLRKESLALF